MKKRGRGRRGGEANEKGERVGGTKRDGRKEKKKIKTDKTFQPLKQFDYLLAKDGDDISNFCLILYSWVWFF